MYIARVTEHNKIRYLLRTSYYSPIDKILDFKQIFDLGPDPSVFIHYIGTNAFYFSDEIENALRDAGLFFDSDEIEDLLWPWIRADVRRAVETFKGRSGKPRARDLTEEQTAQLRQRLSSFDLRRLHFLKFGTMSQGPVDNMPHALFKHFSDCSRDEIEQYFIRNESVLRERDLKSYVYTAFDIQRFFKSFMAKEMPHAMDQNKVDDYFLKEICRFNTDLFKQGDLLHPYLRRYLFMFFDHGYADSRLLDDFANAFMNRHRFYRSGSRKPGTPNPVSTDRALAVFRLTPKQFKTLTPKELTRIYRKLARKAHPDIGGTQDAFIELGDAYQTLMEQMEKEKPVQ